MNIVKPTICNYPHILQKYKTGGGILQTKWPDLGEEKLLNLLRREVVQLSDRFNKKSSFTASSYGGRDLSIIAYGNFFFQELGQLHPLLLRRLYQDVNGKHRKKVQFVFLTLEAVPVQVLWHAILYK